MCPDHFKAIFEKEGQQTNKQTNLTYKILTENEASLISCPKLTVSVPLQVCY